LAYFESDFWHPSVATDAVILSLHKNTLSVLLAKRGDGQGWALPGGFIQKGESLDECVRRELREETGIEVPYLHNYGIYSDPRRDPRGQIISVAYVAVHPSGKLKLHADTDVIDVGWFDVSDLPALAFDHSVICSDGIKYAQDQIEQHPRLYSPFWLRNSLSLNFKKFMLRWAAKSLLLKTNVTFAYGWPNLAMVQEWLLKQATTELVHTDQPNSTNQTLQLHEDNV